MLDSFKRFFLLTLLVLTGLSALIIGGAVFRQGCTAESMSWAVTGAIGCGMLFVMSFAAFTALDRPGWRFMSICGMLLAAMLLLLLPTYIAWEILDPVRVKLGVVGIGKVGHVQMARFVVTGILNAGLLCLVPFVMIPRMKRVGRIVQYTTVLYSTVAYVAALRQLWDMSGEQVQQALITLLIPAGVCMMGVFVLHKFFEIRRPDLLSAVAETVQLKCPRCHNEQQVGFGDSRCTVCRLKFTIEVEEPKCPNCGFDLHQLTRPLCPECGLNLNADDVPEALLAKDDRNDERASDGAVPFTQ